MLFAILALEAVYIHCSVSVGLFRSFELVFIEALGGAGQGMGIEGLEARVWAGV